MTSLTGTTGGVRSEIGHDEAPFVLNSSMLLLSFSNWLWMGVRSTVVVAALKDCVRVSVRFSYSEADRVSLISAISFIVLGWLPGLGYGQVQHQGHCHSLAIFLVTDS